MIDSHIEPARLSAIPDGPSNDAEGFAPRGCRSELTSRWFVIVTQCQAETDVERSVRSLGLPTWLARHEDREHHVRLAFPRYLFMQADLGSGDRWREVYTQRGVDTVLGTRGERPTPMRIGSLVGLFDACAPDGVMYRDAPKPRGPPIPAGSGVRIAAGKFAGWEGVCRWSSARRVEVLLSVMGREVPVQMPVELVERAGSTGRRAG